MYYHYTNCRGAKAIRLSGYLQPSEESGAFGSGVYLTDLDPKKFFRDEILMNNYGGIKSEFHNRADWVVEILKENIKMHLLRQVHVPGENRRIFVYPYSISVHPDQIIDKPKCVKSYVFDDYDTSTDDSEDVCSESGSDCNLSEHEVSVNDNVNYENEDMDNLSDECEINEHEDLSNASEEEDSNCCEYEVEGDDAPEETERGSDESENETDGNDGDASHISGDESGSDDFEYENDGDGSIASDGDYEYEDLYYESEQCYYVD